MPVKVDQRHAGQLGDFRFSNPVFRKSMKHQLLLHMGLLSGIVVARLLLKPARFAKHANLYRTMGRGNDAKVLGTMQNAGHRQPESSLQQRKLLDFEGVAMFAQSLKDRCSRKQQRAGKTVASRLFIFLALPSTVAQAGAIQPVSVAVA